MKTVFPITNYRQRDCRLDMDSGAGRKKIGISDAMPVIYAGYSVLFYALYHAHQTVSTAGTVINMPFPAVCHSGLLQLRLRHRL